MAAGLYQAGHDLAVTELAPEAVIKQDFELLDSLFERMSSQTVDGWHLKGKVNLSHPLLRDYFLMRVRLLWIMHMR